MILFVNYLHSLDMIHAKIRMSNMAIIEVVQLLQSFDTVKIAVQDRSINKNLLLPHLVNGLRIVYSCHACTHPVGY